MGVFRKTSSNNRSGSEIPGGEAGPPAGDPASNPDLIKVFDGYGREMFITKQQWKDNVLLGNLEKARNDPDHLYSLLAGALSDGFAADIVSYAEQLGRTDPVPARGATILGIAYMQVNRLDDAERVLNDFLSAHGEDGTVLTNLAKVYSRRGDDTRAESILWHALEVDPNQENALGWYAAIHGDRGGDGAALDAYRRVAALPRSWRAQLWLARAALQTRDLAAAEALYRHALATAGHPVPSDLLMQMSGDLGRNGNLTEIIRLVRPHFEPTVHGLQVGNNLIKANCDLGQLDAARHLVGQLYAQNRPDWKETLNYWDTEVAKAGLAKKEEKAPETPSVTLMSIEGPLWTRDRSRLITLLPTKRAEPPQIVVFGSTVLFGEPPKKGVAQLSDGPGRLSRAVPLFLAERIHLATDGVGSALIPWMQDHGFAVFGHPYQDEALAALAGKSGTSPGHVVGVTVEVAESPWKLVLRVVRTSDGRRIAEAQVETALENPGPSVEILADRLIGILTDQTLLETIQPPSWYRLPAGLDLSDYLLRIEQQLAVFCAHIESLKGGQIFGEHAILDGVLQLCVRQPTNPLVRMVLAETLRHMRKVRPEILPEYRDKIDLLQRDHPILGSAADLIAQTLAEALASPS